VNTFGSAVEGCGVRWSTPTMMQTARHFRSFVGILVLGIFAGVCYWVFRLSPEQLLREAERAFAQHQFVQAETLARSVVTDSPHFAGALLLAGKASIRRGRPDDAVGYLDRVPDDSNETVVEARFMAGEILLTRLFRPTEAEQRFRRVLMQNPEHVPSHRLLARLMVLYGRRWEAIALRLELLRLDSFTSNDLAFLAEPETFRENLSLLATSARRNLTDPLVKLGTASALRQHESARAEALLREVLVAAPNLIEAQVRLGSTLLDSGRTTDFLAWNAQLPPVVESHPETWALRGDYANSQGDFRGAARCYWNSLRCDPCRQRATYQLGQMLLALKKNEQAAVFLERSAMLQDVQLLMKRYTINPEDTMHQAAGLCEKLGLLWEAWGWSRMALLNNPQLTWATETVQRLTPLLTPDLTRVSPDADVTRMVDLSDIPVPRWESTGNDSQLADTVPVDHNIQFGDEASSAGLSFTYFNDADPRTPAARPFEFTGGGVAILDYDGDGWPDLYLTQGCQFPLQDDQVEHVDRLFRNLGNGRFEDVTKAACLREDRYSQGVTVGDYNDDGHPDLYVANLDVNRQYRNNGDGTFSDVTYETGTGGDGWTTSCLMADLNGDAWPDIYAVNYLAGSDVFERICRHSGGKPRMCTPYDFEAAQDQLYLNLGDGRFEEWTNEGGINVSHGKGLGIVAVDLTGTGRPNLFVANDTDANCYFVNETSSPETPPLLRESAIESGLAFERNGLTQACMGVAVGDANADGLIDLFVTNYYDEANTLYLQQPGGWFRDATRQAGLLEPSLPVLGFGTQFIDGELDGYLDLIATNGHVEDNRSRNIPYQMRPQYFCNRGGKQFEELSAESLGPFFQRDVLGRGLARVDWNRDGREDVVISHLDAPAALLTNRTLNTGHFLAIQLRGVRTSRDAIGTTVQIRVGDKTWIQQLTAGDGYQASNQRQLIFGLGRRNHVDDLIINWPSGLSQSFTSPPIDTELFAIENRQDLMKMPGKKSTN